MCRRFGFLHQRLLLHRQDELRDLEDQLIRLDDEDQEEMPISLKSRKLDDSREGSYRKALMEEIDDKLGQYGPYSWSWRLTMDSELISLEI